MSFQKIRNLIPWSKSWERRVKPEPDKVSAVVNMEAPQNITELRRFLGMVNQLGKFLPNLATETEPLRGLLSTGSSWYWDQPQRDAFNEIKRMLSWIVKCRRRAVQSVWWPGLSRNIKELIDNCRVCCQATKNHPEPLIPTLMPERRWQKVAADLMEFKKAQYLVVVDYYSRYIELSKLESTTSY